MNTRLTKVAKLSLLTVASTVLVISGTGWGFPDPQSSTPPSTSTTASPTEDIIYTTDGRELHGRIISETRTHVVFEFVDQKTKIKSTLTLDKDKIAEIKKGVPLPGSAATEAPASGGSTSSTPATGFTAKPAEKAADKSKDAGRGFVSQLNKDAKDVPSFYVVPIRGQVGTDVISETYKEVAADIKAVKPDLIVLKMDCKDVEQTFAAALGQMNAREMGLLDFEDGHLLVNLFHDDLRDVRQVIWVNDSVGLSSPLAMSWKEIYMTPSARLGGMVMVLAMSGAKGHADSDVRAKMYAAWTGMAKSFLEYGGYSPILGDAMIDPEFMLSATWRGRDVQWTLDTDGEFVVDADDERPSNFNAKMCEDFCISKGIAENMDDLALLLGYREYRLADGKAEKIVGDYITDWRRAFGDAKEAMEKYDQFMGWASGPDQVKYLGQAKAQLERVLSAINRYKAVEKRMQSDLGIDKMSLTLRIEDINQTLRQLKNNAKSGGAGGGGRTSGGGRTGQGGGREGG